MLKRTLTGACYVAIIVAFFLLREYVDYRLFYIFLALLNAIGTYEIAKAEKEYTVSGNFVLSLILGVIIVPFYVFLEYLFLSNGIEISYLLITLAFCLVVAIIGILIAKLNLKDEQSLRKNVLPFLYPSLLIVSICAINSFVGDKSFIALLLLFVISPCSDTMAYLVGMTYSKIKKGNVKKLCPNLSPKKTVAGMIGGLLGGVLAGLIVYFIFKERIESVIINLPLLIICVLGLVGSFFTQIGDLFESYIKRRIGIKDLGNILPGHGGVMDRIDGTLFLGLFLAVVFAFI